MLLPVIMAGGTGSRLWPMSRELYPKQFLQLYGENSMLQETIIRLDGVETREPIIICNEEHRFLVAEQLRQVNRLSKNIILEPMGRNTAPAIALAALHAITHEEDPILLILAADHVISDRNVFHSAIKDAYYCASQDFLVTFGIVPTSPETGYGYIQYNHNQSILDNHGYMVQRFVEKPNLETAKLYVESGEYYWNSGIFMFKAKKYLDELNKYHPDILTICQQAIQPPDEHSDFVWVNKEHFIHCCNESIDYAVMEKTTDAVVVPMDAGWSDVGSWSTLWSISEKDSNNNAIKGDVFLHDTNGCYINTDEKFVAAIGVSDLCIVNTKDALLVVNKEKVQDVKKVVEYLKEFQRSEYRRHRETYHSWGHCDLIVQTERFNINRLTVKPGATFPLQMHYHHTEYWVVLSGTAKITIEDKTILLTENQSTFIPIGHTHMLENPGKIVLEILEIQSGSYLGEDDLILINEQSAFNEFIEDAK